MNIPHYVKDIKPHSDKLYFYKECDKARLQKVMWLKIETETKTKNDFLQWTKSIHEKT